MRTTSRQSRVAARSKAVNQLDGAGNPKNSDTEQQDPMQPAQGESDIENNDSIQAEEVDPSGSDGGEDASALHRRAGRSAKKGKKKISRIVLVLLIVLGVLLATGIGMAVYVNGQMQIMKYSDDPSMGTEEPDQTETPDPALPNIDSGAVESALPAQTAVPIVQSQSSYNIVLFGLDTRDPKRFSGARSDVMMLVSIDTEKKTVKLTSFMRDILIKIPGHDNNRLNTAFVFGGPELAMTSLKQNFGVQADWFAVINFWAFSDVIDALGGVDINVKSNEISNMNKSIGEINKLASSGKRSATIRKAGVQHLNGRQAVAYMRIRHVGNGDFERTQRQRTVLNKLTEQMSKLSLADAIRLAGVIPKYTKTNMNQNEILEMANKLYSVRGAKVQELRIPTDGSYKMGNYKGMSILLIDFTKNLAALTDFLEK